MMDLQSKYWDKTWQGRVHEDGTVDGNKKKFRRIMDYLWSKPQFFNLKKLDVGCGPAHHAIAMSHLAKGFAENWTGVDLSECAVAFAVKHDMDALCLDFLDWDPFMSLTGCEPFDVFFFWDTLEHFEDLNVVAKQVRFLAKEKFTIAGNVPLFVSPIHEEGGVEKPMSIHIVQAFLQDCGCSDIWHEVYGTHGLPFLMFEAGGGDK